MSTLSENIKKYRIFRRITQQEVADHIGKSKGVISNWERGDNQPSPDEVEKLCKLFHITPNEIYGWEENKEYTRYLEFKKVNEIKLEEYKKQMQDLQSAINDIESKLSDGFADDTDKIVQPSLNDLFPFNQFQNTFKPMKTKEDEE